MYCHMTCVAGVQEVVISVSLLCNKLDGSAAACIFHGINGIHHHKYISLHNVLYVTAGNVK